MARSTAISPSSADASTSPGPPPELCGQRVGKYDLLRVIGSGGMGVVYEARHSYTGKRVAVKVMRRDPTHSAENMRRFLREARSASAIGHPSIVDVLDAALNEDGLVYLVLELLEGQSLHERIQTSSLSTPQIVNVTVEILDCLAAAHARGIVHRDIKPENIFLTSETPSRVRVLDFGLAKHLRATDTAATRDGVILGTPDFMSPEQARGKAIDARTDLWSVGALVFDACAGRPPFVAPDVLSLILKIVNEGAPSLAEFRPDLPDFLVNVVAKALQKDVALRWQSAEEMAAALRQTIPVLANLDPVTDTDAARSARLAWSVRRPAAPSPPEAVTAPGDAPSAESRVRVRTAPVSSDRATAIVTSAASLEVERPRRRWWIAVALVVTLLAIVFALAKWTGRRERSPAPPAPPQATVPVSPLSAQRPAAAPVPQVTRDTGPPPRAPEPTVPDRKVEVRRPRGFRQTNSDPPSGTPRRRTDPVHGYD